MKGNNMAETPENVEWLIAIIGVLLKRQDKDGAIFDIDELVEFDNGRMAYSVDESENNLIVSLGAESQITREET